MPRISGERTQAGTGKIVSYLVEYQINEGTTGSWGGNILLREGKRHTLAGGVLANVTTQTIGAAVNLALNAEIDSLNIDSLNRIYGN